MKTDELSRRSFIKKAGQFGAALALGKEILAGKSVVHAQKNTVEKPVFTGKEKMIVLSSKPIVLEMPHSGFDNFITETDMFFVRNNIGMPEVDINRWRLTVNEKVKIGTHPNGTDLRKIKEKTSECRLFSEN